MPGKLCFHNLWPVTNVTGQGNGLRSWIVREKRGGQGITVKAKKQIKNNYIHITENDFVIRFDNHSGWNQNGKQNGK
jgi:hypothetical protein